MDRLTLYFYDFQINELKVIERTSQPTKTRKLETEATFRAHILMSFLGGGHCLVLMRKKSRL